MAVASLILGILGIPFALYLVPGSLALIFGNVALTQMRRASEPQNGRGMAIAGVVLGWISLAIFVVLIVTLSIVSSTSRY